MTGDERALAALDDQLMKSLRDRDRTMVPARAADGDGEAGFALVPRQRQHVRDQAVDMTEHLVGRR